MGRRFAVLDVAKWGVRARMSGIMGHFERLGHPMLVVSLVTVLSACRDSNPRFGPGSEQTRRDEEPGKTGEDPSPPGGQTGEGATRVDNDSSTTQSPAGSNPTSASDPQSSSTGGESTGGETTSGEETSAEVWGKYEPKPSANGNALDLCAWGSKACFVFGNPSAPFIVSRGDGLATLSATQTSLGAPTPISDIRVPPLDAGVSFGSSDARVETLDAYPQFAGQELGFEVWYRVNDVVTPLPKDEDNVNMMVTQLPADSWISEDRRDGAVGCALPGWDSSEPDVRRPGLFFLGHRSAPGNYQGLRVVACFMKEGRGYAFLNGAIMKSGLGITEDGPETKLLPRFTFGLKQDLHHRRFAAGIWGLNNQAEANFMPFQGTIYMVRIWNNVSYMQDAMLALMQHHNLDVGALSKSENDFGDD